MDTRPRGLERSDFQLSRRLPLLFVVTGDKAISRPGFLETAAAVLSSGGGRCALQLRAHGIVGARFIALARELLSIARAAGSTLWINDRIDAALTLRADGVQLGSLSPSPLQARRLLGTACWIGRSVHSADEAAYALGNSADVAVLGNVFPSASHPGRAPLGPEEVRRAAGGGRPIVAIGGITEDNLTDVIEAGACGVAVLSGIWNADDPAQATKRYLAVLARASSDQ